MDRGTYVVNVLSIASTLTSFPLAFMPFPPNPPLVKIVDFPGILQAGGPNNWNMWTARGKIIGFSDPPWSTYFPSRRVCG